MLGNKLGSLEAQPVLLTAEPTLHPSVHVFLTHMASYSVFSHVAAKSKELWAANESGHPLRLSIAQILSTGKQIQIQTETSQEPAIKVSAQLQLDCCSLKKNPVCTSCHRSLRH